MPNTNVDVHDAAFPGTLPVRASSSGLKNLLMAGSWQVLDLNAIRLSIMTALALNCHIVRHMTF